MRILVTGGSGVLGRHAIPLLEAAGHDVSAPAHDELDLFDAEALERAAADADAILHLATRVGHREENDRLRSETSRLLVDAALAHETGVYVQPSVTFVDTDPDGYFRSALDAEAEAARFTAAGRRGVVLRLGLLDGPGTGNDGPDPKYGATLHVEDAGRALVLALGAPAGLYDVCRDGERVSNQRFKQATGWRPER